MAMAKKTSPPAIDWCTKTPRAKEVPKTAVTMGVYNWRKRQAKLMTRRIANNSFRDFCGRLKSLISSSNAWRKERGNPSLISSSLFWGSLANDFCTLHCRHYSRLKGNKTVSAVWIGHFVNRFEIFVKRAHDFRICDVAIDLMIDFHVTARPIG